jgi:peptide/nickel transport system ATP-binding protein
VPARDDRHRTGLPAALLIADEPTTGLDVTTQAAVMDLLTDAWRANAQMATLFITHDLALAADHCDRIVVMHAGHVVEQAPSRELFAARATPTRRALIRSVPASAGTLAAWSRCPAACPTCARPTCRPAASSSAASRPTSALP